jgi:hypothetical protein
MGGRNSKLVPARPVPAEGLVRVCVAGFGLSHHTGRARAIAERIVEGQPDKFESWFYFDSKGFRGEGGFLPTLLTELSEEDQKKFAAHKQSPFTWLEYPDGHKTALGGRDRLCDWVNNDSGEFKETFAADKVLQKLTNSGPGLGELWVNEKPGPNRDHLIYIYRLLSKKTRRMK